MHRRVAHPYILRHSGFALPKFPIRKRILQSLVLSVHINRIRVGYPNPPARFQNCFLCVDKEWNWIRHIYWSLSTLPYWHTLVTVYTLPSSEFMNLCYSAHLKFLFCVENKLLFCLFSVWWFNSSNKLAVEGVEGLLFLSFSFFPIFHFTSSEETRPSSQWCVFMNFGAYLLIRVRQ